MRRSCFGGFNQSTIGDTLVCLLMEVRGVLLVVYNVNERGHHEANTPDHPSERQIGIDFKKWI